MKIKGPGAPDLRVRIAISVPLPAPYYQSPITSVAVSALFYELLARALPLTFSSPLCIVTTCVGGRFRPRAPFLRALSSVG